MAIETPSRYTYDLDGSTRVFFVPTIIKGEDYCRLEVDSTIINDRSKFDIVNNSIVFVDAADVPSGSQLDVLVVQSDESLGQLSITSNIDIVAQNIDNVNIVGDNTANVDAVAGISSNITKVAGISTSVEQVALDTVALNEVYTNRIEIYQADDNAATATAQATIATTQASNAALSASAASGSASTATTQASNAASSASSASLSATAAGNSVVSAASSASDASSSAGIATTKASEASTSATASALSETNAAISEANALDYANSINPTQINEDLASLKSSTVSKVASSVLLNKDSLAFTAGTSIVLTEGKLVFTDGRASNGGYNVSTQDFTGSIDFAGISDGIKYVGLDEVGNVVAYDDVSIGLYDKTSADDNRLTFDTESGKWFTTTGGELVTNGTFDTDVSGITAYGSNVTISNPNNNLSVVVTAGGSGCSIIVSGLVVGEEYSYNWDFSGVLTRMYIQQLGINTPSFNPGLEKYTLIATDTVTKIVFASDGANTYNIDNISVYKKEATLDTPLTSPICFIDDKPYQITSETPMDRLVDYPSIPKNIMEDTSISNLTVTEGFDLGQSWVDVTSERVAGVTYINDTGKPIVAIVVVVVNNSNSQLFIDDENVSLVGDSAANYQVHNVPIPIGSYYRVVGTITKWSELR